MPWRTALLAFLLFAAGACLKADAPALPLLSALAGQNKQAQAAASQPLALSGTVTLRPRLTAHGPNVTLGDLIEQGLPPDVAAIAVKPADGPGTTMDLDPALVALKLRKAPGGPYALKSGYGPLRVDVPSQAVAGKVLLDFARGYLEAQLSGTAGVDIQPQGKVFGLTLYDAQLRFRVRPPEDHPLRGYVELRVDVLQNSASGEDKVVATVPVSFLVRRREPRMVTTQAVNRGDALGPDNVAVAVMDTTFAADGFPDLQSIQDKVAKTYIAAGTPVDVDMVDLPLAIHVGDTVKLLVRSGAIEIEASARAVRDARVGDTLPLEITDTGKMVQARCVDMDVAVQNAW
jgi:flagella basal body P-ring formation protein FlgA